MFAGGLGRKRSSTFEPPIEMRFVDLFMIIVTTLMFITVMLSIVSALVGSSRVDLVPKIATESLPAALVNRPYQLMLAGTGGTGDYNWHVKSGSLPDGLELEEKGLITGTPTRLERAQFTIELVDTEKRSDSREVVLETRSSGMGAEPIKVTLHVASDTILLPDGVQGQPYRYQLDADGGFPPYQWSLVEGSLPAGLELSSTGEIAGAPTTVGSPDDVMLMTTDNSGATVTQRVRLQVKAGPPPVWLHVLEVILKGLVYLLIGLGVLLVVASLWDDLIGHEGGYVTPKEGRLARILRRRQ